MTGGRLLYLMFRRLGFGTTIFAEMTGLAIKHQAVNPGQGFVRSHFPAAAGHR